ncbi:Rv3235 family protein [Streptomyces sp. NBC_01224]|uniref:Rv3235 family protein n=1 Tax=Streptomyces sp. NBC_01224 TaxID=2903783 RepID=UPI002E15E6B5|nr:Rv3235 family protein [Streptomyces sp. NBC_01224]
MSTNRTRPTGRHDRRRPESVPQQRTRTPRRVRPHHWFAERLLAVLSGQRPVHWMLGHTIGEAYDQLAELAPRTPLRARGARPVIRMCHGAQPAPGVVEAWASIAAGEQVRAMAFRLEQGTDLRWRCAAVELGDEHLQATPTR